MLPWLTAFGVLRAAAMCRELAAQTIGGPLKRHLLAAGAAVFLLQALCAAPVQAEGKKVLFLAGPRDHGAPGRHEYERDLRTLAQSLEQSSNLQGVTTQLMVGSLPRDAATRIGGDPAELDIFALITNFTEERGVPWIVEAFRNVRSPKARLLLVGRSYRPGMQAKLERLAGDDRRIIFWGEEHDIAQVYTLADYVLRGEAYPCVGRTIYEALFSGCGVVIPGDAANHDLFEYERFADRVHFYRPRDREHFVAVLDSLAGKKRLVKRGESNVQRYVAEFDRFVRGAIGAES